MTRDGVPVEFDMIAARNAITGDPASSPSYVYDGVATFAHLATQGVRLYWADGTAVCASAAPIQVTAGGTATVTLETTDC